MSESKLDIEGILANARASANKRTEEGYSRVSHLRRQETTHGTKKKTVDTLPILDSEVSNEVRQLDAIYSSVVIKGNNDFFVNQNNVILFLDSIVAAIHKKAKDKKIDQISLEEKNSIVDKLRKTEELLNIALKVNSKIDDSVSVSSLDWIKFSIKIIKQQLERYK